ncbi:MAG: sensor histidine kinase [Hyphomonadaceae bacterium]
MRLMLKSEPLGAPTWGAWIIAATIVAMQLALSVGLLWANSIAESADGRRVVEVAAAEAPARAYTRLPEDAFEIVRLPREGCCSSNSLVFRTRLTAADAALDEPSVLIVSAYDNALLYLEGELVAGFGRSEGPPPNMGRRPQLLRLPPSLVREGAILDITVQRAVGFGYFRPFFVGEYNALYRSFNALTFLRQDLPLFNAGIGAFVAAFCFCAAPLFGARGLMLSLAGLGASWTFQHVGLFLNDPPWGVIANTGLYFWGFLGACVCMPWFFIEWTSVFSRATPRRGPIFAFALDPWDAPARRELAVACIAILAVGGALIGWRLSFDPAIAFQDANRIIGWLGLFAMAFSLVRIVAFYLRPGSRDPIAASAFVFVVLAAIADISMVRFLRTTGVFLGAAVTFFPLALLLSLAFRARGIFEAATATAEKLNGLVADREREIVRNHEEIRRNERAAMLLEERSRIMRDMHDGIGGQLIGLILQARSKKLSGDALVAGLEQSLDDLRMVVDSLEQGEGSLTGALGAFRARIEPRCEAAGVELAWEINDVGETPGIGPDKTLQIYRVLLEACTNALKHSGATRLIVSLRRRGEVIEISVADNGKGFSAGVGAGSGGRGLANMEARAQRIGATLELHSEPDATIVALKLPA